MSEEDIASHTEHTQWQERRVQLARAAHIHPETRVAVEEIAEILLTHLSCSQRNLKEAQWQRPRRSTAPQAVEIICPLQS
jgi:hypothetical protein